MSKKILFNMWNRKYISLKKGEIYCDECQGRGGYEIVKECNHNKNYEAVELRRCKRCDGEGKLDWVSQAVEKKSDKISYALYRRHKKSNKVSDIKIYGKGKFPLYNIIGPSLNGNNLKWE